PPAPGAGPTPPAADSARTAAAAPPAAQPAKAVYRVQVASVESRKSAEDAAKKARSLGMTVVTVQDKGLYKVRVGEYRTREAAQTAATSLKPRLGGSPFVGPET